VMAAQRMGKILNGKAKSPRSRRSPAASTMARAGFRFPSKDFPGITIVDKRYGWATAQITTIAENMLTATAILTPCSLE
jgi:hypothetical protein